MRLEGEHAYIEDRWMRFAATIDAVHYLDAIACLPGQMQQLHSACHGDHCTQARQARDPERKRSIEYTAFTPGVITRSSCLVCMRCMRNIKWVLPETHIKAVKCMRKRITHAPLLTQNEQAWHAKQILIQQA